MSFRQNLSPDQKMAVIVAAWVLVIGALCVTLYALTPPAPPLEGQTPLTVNPATAPGAESTGEIAPAGAPAGEAAPQVFTAPGAAPPQSPGAGAPQVYTAPGVNSAAGSPNAGNSGGRGPRVASNPDFRPGGDTLAPGNRGPSAPDALPVLPPPRLGAPRAGSRPAMTLGANSPGAARPVNGAAQSAFEAGSAALRAGNKSGALAEFARAVRLAPDNLPSRLQLASLYLDLNQPAKAVPHLREAARLDPKNPAVQFTLARALLADKKLEAALPALRKTVQLAPDEREARVVLARVLFERKQPQQAYEQWAALAQKNPKDVEAQMQAAGIAGDVLKKPAQAEKWLRRAVAAAPGEPQPAIALGQVLLQQKDAKGAVAVLSKAAQARPDAFGIYPLLADAHTAAGDTKGAAAALQSALAKLPSGKTEAQRAQIAATRDELRLALARTLAASRQWKEADAQFALYAQARPNDAQALLLWAQVAQERKDFKGQIEALSKAVRVAPKNAGVWTQLALAQRAGGDKKGALASFEKLGALRPGDADVLFEQARLQSELGDHSAAFANWKGVVAVRPQAVEAYPGLLEAADKAGRNPEARQFLAREMAKGENPAALQSVLAFYRKRDRSADARAFLTDLLARAPRQNSARNALAALQPTPAAAKPAGDKTAAKLAPTLAPATAAAKAETPKVQIAAAPTQTPARTPSQTPPIAPAAKPATRPLAAPTLATSAAPIALPQRAAAPLQPPLVVTKPTP